MEVDVSIIIPTFNSSAFVTKAIDSAIASATPFSYEIVIVDDKSDDLDDLRRLISSVGNVVLVEKSAKGTASESRNIGLQRACGAVVFFLDSDDMFLVDHISNRVGLHKSSAAGIVFGDYLVQSCDQISAGRVPRYSGEDMRAYLFEKCGDVRSSTISIARSQFRGTLFDPLQAKHQDWGFAIRAFDGNETVAFDERRTVILSEVANAHRMSCRLNIAASAYFVEAYVKEGQHMMAFSASHLLLAIRTKDKAAVLFLRELMFSARRRATQGKWIRFLALVLATVLPGTAFSAGMLEFHQLIKRTLAQWQAEHT
jgi:glycosyltransferase involved in cell wall biosynthesis